MVLLDRASFFAILTCSLKDAPPLGSAPGGYALIISRLLFPIPFCRPEDRKHCYHIYHLTPIFLTLTTNDPHVMCGGAAQTQASLCFALLLAPLLLAKP